MEWYPSNKKELDSLLNKFMQNKTKAKEVHGLIVPHAGYSYSGSVAGKAFALLKNSKIKKAVVIGPSHYVAFSGLRALRKIKTPFGEMKVSENNLEKLEHEHSVENQIPFLQKLGFKEVLPFVVGEISEKQAKEIAEEISKIKAIYIFSSDLSHFFPYEDAVKRDKKTIEIIEKLDIKRKEQIDACGIYGLEIMMELCKIKSWKPRLIEYKNSGEITGDKSSVVGYASFEF